MFNFIRIFSFLTVSCTLITAFHFSKVVFTTVFFFPKGILSAMLINLDIHGSVHRRLLSRNTNKMQLCNRIYYSKVY